MIDHKRLLTPADESKSFYGFVVVAVSFLIMLIAWGTYYSFGVFFVPILTELGWTRAMTAGAFSLAMIIQGPAGMVLGRATDRRGPRMVMSLGGLLLGLGYLLMSQIHAIWQLYVFYGVMMGIGMGAPYVSLAATIARWFTKKRGLMNGIVMAGVGLGAVIVPPLATRLISIYDWRTSYLILGGASLALVVIASQFLKRDPAQIGQAPYGHAEAGKQPAGTGTAVTFREAVRTRQLWLACGMSFCHGYCLFFIMVHIAPHTADLGFSAANGATVISIIGVASMVSKVGLGHVADRAGGRTGYFIAFTLAAIVMLSLMTIRDLRMLYVAAALFGIAYGGWAATQAPLLAELFGLTSLGTVIGMATLIWTVGGALGPFISGYIFDVSLSYQSAFMVAGIVALLGLLLTGMLKLAGKPKLTTAQMTSYPQSR